MTEQTNVPKLRFGEFEGESESLLIQDFAKVTSGGTPNRAIKEYWGGSIPWITTSQINYQDINGAEEFITDEGLKNSSAKLFPKGTLLLALYGQGITRGRVSILNMEATTNQACAALILNGKKSNNRYMLFNLQARYEELRALSNSGGQKNLSGGLIKSLSVALPALDEQKKIASFLSKVDAKVALLTEKKDKLAQYKKGVMQQLFNGKWEKQDGQLIFIPPTLRFKADDGSEFPDWEEKALIELAAQRFSNGVFNDPKRIGKGYRLINVKDMYSGNFIDTSTLSLLDLSEKEFSNNQVKYGDIFFTRSSLVPSGIAYSNVNLSNDNDITYDGHLIKFSPKLDMISPYYFANYLRSHSSRKSLISRGKQSTMTTIGQEDIKDIRFLIPSLEEQIKIANFLSAIDQKIDLANSELEKAKEWKKGLLQQMFV